MRENIEVIASCIASVASILFALIPLDRSRLRAGWAKALFVTIGIVSVVLSVTNLVLIERWVVPVKETARTIHEVNRMLDGFALGLIFSLILSRQLFGSKRGSQETEATALIPG